MRIAPDQIVRTPAVFVRPYEVRPPERLAAAVKRVKLLAVTAATSPRLLRRVEQ